MVFVEWTESCMDLPLEKSIELFCLLKYLVITPKNRRNRIFTELLRSLFLGCVR